MKILIPGLLVFVAWCAVSINWYVCGIYELCSDASPAEQTTPTDPPTPLEREVLTTPYQAPLSFEWSSPFAITNDEFDDFKDSIAAAFGESPGAVVEIIGLYDPQELNNSEYDDLGLARAEEIKQLLLSSGLKRIFRTRSNQDDLSAGLSGNINQAYEFRLVTSEKSTPGGFIISEGRKKLVIHFPSNSAKPASDKQVQLAVRKMSKSAKKNSQKLLVVGHTDNQGDSMDNNKLGLIRATEVKEMLQSYGMEEKDVLAESEGENQPLVTNNTPQGRQQNRRVEIIII